VFIHHGGYTNPHQFIRGFTPAIWVAVALSALGILAAALIRQPLQTTEAATITIAVPDAQAA
jgi:hypothetical protein